MIEWGRLDYAEAWHLRHVPRWVAIASNRRQSVAEHEHGVLVIARMLMDNHPRGHEPEFRLEVYECTVGHDREESITGDHPSPTKAPKSPEGMSQAQILVKCADILEAIGFLHEEIALGNQRLKMVLRHVLMRLAGWSAHLESINPFSANDVMYQLGLGIRPTFPLMIQLGEEEKI